MIVFLLLNSCCVVKYYIKVQLDCTVVQHALNATIVLLQVKEWLCLNCQTQRALRGVEPPGPPASQEKKPQDKPSTTAAPKVQPQDQGKPQQKIPEGPPAAKPAQVQEADQQKQEGGFFGFGFGGAKDKARSRSPSPQPAESVSGKVFGFGSSFLSSASNLITSAVQDEPPGPQSPSRKGSIQAQPPSQPASRKGSVQAQPPSQPASRKGSIQAQPPSQPPSRKGSVQAQPTTKVPSAIDIKQSALADQKLEEKKPEARKAVEPAQVKTPSTLPKTESSMKSVQSCPLCKVDLNMGSKDPPNYNTCTECKNMVCNLCGFNPMPHLTEVCIQVFTQMLF